MKGAGASRRKNKVRFVAALSLTDAGHPLRIKLTAAESQAAARPDWRLKMPRTDCGSSAGAR
ncbi:MAG TPA: hypothetical protein P5163_12240 [Rubrivivax sp.]|nr:hypothetical protein [Rubrivivax sp.]HRY89086.1 hypothetical protein [Rubrivivax sp.]HRZ61355.1 hypothetical protein [Rubrivivax sp.]